MCSSNFSFFSFFQEIEKKLEAALACPCVSEYKDSPCGKQFVEAFSCFVRAPDDAK